MQKKLFFLLCLTLYSLSNALYLEIKTLKLRDQEACQDDVERFCPDDKSSNTLLLSCLQDKIPDDREVSTDCQNLIWNIKWNITRGEASYVPAKNYNLCSADLEEMTNCKQEKEHNGPYIACLVERIDEIQGETCFNFLRLLQPLIYSNYKLIYRLSEVCSSDIEKYKCGRSNRYFLADQGSTLDCLSERLDDLLETCQEEVLRVAEQQGADLKLNRGLFLACKEDSINFCASLLTQDKGRVYDCLLENKADPGMSQQCKDKLRARQRLEAEDYKANYRFYQLCHHDIHAIQCHLGSEGVQGGYSDDHTNHGGVDDGVDGGSDKAAGNHSHRVKLTETLLCLETARIRGIELRGECVKEMIQIRKQMMSDPRIIPEVMIACTNEVRRCENASEVALMHKNGLLSSASHRLVLHCIMDLARHTFMHEQATDAISKRCYSAVNMILKQVDVTENLDIDPAFKYDCAISINKFCSGQQRDGLGLMQCLMGLLGSDKMDVECSNRLHEIQFFVARDFRISGTFWSKCNDDISRMCNSEHFGDPASSASSKEISTQAHVLSCLYRNFDNQVSEGCSNQVRVLLEERARSADLPPEIQEACIANLARLCTVDNRDDEMSCLEQNFDRLSPACQKEVGAVVDAEEQVPLITRLFLDSCESFWKQHCELQSKKVDESKAADQTDNSEDSEENDAVALMECLISNKHHPDMPRKCRVGIEHHQLVSLKHFNTNSHFKKACIKDIADHCDNLPDKASVIRCLSERVFNDTMTNSKNHITKRCRKLLTFEVLQMKETVTLDDEVRSACKADRKSFCKDVKAGKGAVVQCLREHQEELSDACRKLIFHREEEESVNPEMDYSLVSKCKRMMQVYCEGSTDVFACLKAHRDDEAFDEACREVVVDRLRLRAKDIRLNPKLLQHCHADIEKYCQDDMKQALQRDFESEGLVLYCLRRIFVHKIKRKHMSESCVGHITTLLRDSALDDLEDAALVAQCSEAIKEKCVAEAEEDKRRFGGTRVVDCLKQHLMNDEGFRDRNTQCFHEIIQRITESKVDIQVDPMLNRVCSLDIHTVCKGVASGEGRVMSCLLMTLNQHADSLSAGCRSALKDRTELWNKAVVLAPPENVAEFVSYIHASPARTFIELTLLSAILLVFCGGLLCGRVTKRISRQAKSK